MKKVTHRFILWSGLLGFATLALVVVASIKPQYLLTSAPIRTVKDLYPVSGYWWISNDRLLIIRHEPASANNTTQPHGLRASGQGLAWVLAPEWRAYTYDIRARRETPLPMLTARLRVHRIGVANRGAVSPDGKWILWAPQYGPDDAIVVSEVEGSGLHTFKVHPQFGLSDHVVWTDQSQTFARFTYSVPRGTIRTVQLFDLQTNRIMPLIRLSQARQLDITPEYLHGVTSMIGWSWQTVRDEVDTRTFIVHMGSVPGTEPIRKVPLPVPDKNVIRWSTVSPDGSRIALVIERKGVSLQDRMRQLVGISPEPPTRLMVAKADGSEMRFVGVVPESRPSTSSDPNFEPYDLRWLPDGKHVSYVRNRTLYVAPVD
jgi:hypothetical protein